MKLSQNFTKTIREAPADETAKNAQLLIRAGYVHKTMAGVYSYLPLGLRMINKIENIVRKNLNAIGGQEILMNTLHPKEWWVTTNRWENVDILFKVKSQTDKEYAIACSHEEQVTPISSTYINSWKDLVEYNPYIFEVDIRDSNITIQKPLRICLHQIIYCRSTDKYLVIDNKISNSSSLFDYYPVGGGIEKNETHVQALNLEFEEETGQSRSRIKSTKYIGDVHQQFPVPEIKGKFEAVNKNIVSSVYFVEVEEFEDGFMEESLSELEKEITKWISLDELKNNILPGFEFAFLNYKTIHNNPTYPTAVYQIQTKFRDELRSKSGVMRGREFRMKDMYDFHRSKESADNYYELVKATYHKIYEEMGLKAYAVHASGGIFTSNDSHEFQVICDAGEDEIFYNPNTGYAINTEIIEEMKAAGQSIPEGLTKAVSAEVGNIFKLDDKYTKAFGLTYTDKDNKLQYPIMNCHGIGTSRTMGVLCEIYSDEKGLKLPAAVAPFEIHLITGINEKDDTDVNNKILDIANRIYDGELKLIKTSRGKYTLLDTTNTTQLLELAKEDSSFDLSQLSQSDEILWDDRTGKTSIGEKLKDADLIGCPTQIIISKKSLENGGLELIIRDGGEKFVIGL
jgi:prolyl-tRNA synthetase/8-oxo-dGTP pyrophosphatase MutT (NUDIX family)